MIILLPSLVSGLLNIMEFGAVPGHDTLSAQFANSRAINSALLFANSSDFPDRTVLIPKAKFFSMPILLDGLVNVTLQIDGQLIASKNVSKWPKVPGSGKYFDFVRIINCQDIVLRGEGKIDGRGYHWWVLVLIVSKRYLPDNNFRPHLIIVENTSNFVIAQLRLKNSPMYHIKLDDVTNGTIHSLDIRVNATAQFNLLKRFSAEGVLPMYAFNTDGIDPHGSNLHIYNLTVLNYDDVVVPKPGNRKDRFGPCTQNMLIENINIKLGVGMTIGSVPPNKDHACIRNITFRNVYFRRPFKAIYVKTNPGEEGDGQIRDILYQNMTLFKPIWWAIYIGPQQMKEPDGDGPGCLLYPYDPKKTCRTQPRISISNITLVDIKVHDSLLYPITIRCNETNPCLGFNFTNVKVDRWRIGRKQTGVDCLNVRGVQENNSPHISCFDANSPSQIVGREQMQEGMKMGWQELQSALKQLEQESNEEQVQQNQPVEQLIMMYREDELSNEGLE